MSSLAAPEVTNSLTGRPFNVAANFQTKPEIYYIQLLQLYPHVVEAISISMHFYVVSPEAADNRCRQRCLSNCMVDLDVYVIFAASA